MIDQIKQISLSWTPMKDLTSKLIVWVCDTIKVTGYLGKDNQVEPDCQSPPREFFDSSSLC